MKNWQQVQEIFIGAMRQTPEDRPVFLNRMCRKNKTLRREVESLLSSYDSAGSFLETPAVTVETPEAETRQFATGQNLGHYEIIKQIGRGGMGEVYLAHDKTLDRKVAVKVLYDKFSQHESNLQRFIREAKTASGLNHPNILVIHEIGETENTRYIVSEHIEGKTLREFTKDKTLKLSEVLDFSIQIAGALSAAHAAHLVHRDIKPENIMIRPDGFVKILDFGLAKLIEQKNKSLMNLEAGTKKNETAKGVILGTVNYMSPEQAKGKKVDERTDIFSFGVVLYEMLTGQIPFEGETVNHTIVAILEKEPLLPEDIPDELQRIVRQALTKGKKERYQTAQNLLTDLTKLKKDLDFREELERTIDPNKDDTRRSGNEKDTVGQNAISTSSLEYAVTQLRMHKLASAIIGVIILCMISAFTYYALLPNSPEIQIESIAVMPFVNESEDKDAEYLSDGMTETLINSLSKIPNLNVKARSTVFRYKGKETNSKTIGQELNVKAILNGRVFQRGDQLTISLELINPATESVLWGNTYERKSSELISLQTEITRDVSGKLITGLSDTDEQKVTKTYTTDTEAYKLYLKGRFQWNKRTGDALKQAASFFNQALETDPLYALAYSGLAEAYVLFPDYNAASPVESYPKAKAAALRALEIDDSLAAPHSVLASYLSSYEWDREGAEREYRRAIELNPNSASAHQWLGYHLAKIKRFDEAFAELRQAEQLDPLSPIIRTNIGDVFIFARRYDEAIAQYNRVLSFDPNFLYARMNLGWALHLKGRYQEAIAEFEKAIEVYYEPLIKSFIAASLVKSGRRNEAIKLLDELKAESESGQIYVPNYAIANVYLALNEKDEAFIWMEKDLAERATYPTYFAVVPDLDPLRADPRFKDMLKRLNLPE